MDSKSLLHTKCKCQYHKFLYQNTERNKCMVPKGRCKRYNQNIMCI